MNRTDDFIGRLEDYLVEFDGVTPLPARVKDAIHAELPRTGQARPLPRPLNVLAMLPQPAAGARSGLVAAMVVAAVVLGAALINYIGTTGVGGRGGFPVSSATPAPTGSPTPAPRALQDAPPAACDQTDTGKGCLAAGTYQLTGDPGDWPATVSFDVPAGWFEWAAGTGYDGVLVDGGPTARGDSGWGVMFFAIGNVYRDPCAPTAGTYPRSDVGTPEGLAAAMAHWPGFAATAPEPITVDGHRGVLVRVTSTKTTRSCAAQAIWTTLAGVPVDAYPMVNDQGRLFAGTFRIVDTGNGLLVIRATDFPETSPEEAIPGIALDPNRHAADQIELRSIIDSIRLDGGAPGS